MSNLPKGERHHFGPIESAKHKAYLCACMDHRFFERILEEFRAAAGTRMVYLETEAGGAPAFGSEPGSARLAHQHAGIQARIMGWAAHGDGCGGFPGRSNDEMREKLLATVNERRRDFPDCKHLALFATEAPDGGVDVELWQF